MSRVKRGTVTHRRHANLLERAKGFRVTRRTLFKRANEALLKAGQFAYRDRRTKKRDFRRAWIVTINAAARQNGMTYSQFIHSMKVQNVDLNRKVLAEMARNDSVSFAAVSTKVSA